MDPMIKRIILDPPVKMPPSSLRMAGVVGFFAFTGLTFYGKFVMTKSMEQKIAKDMYAQVPQPGH